MQNGSRKKTWSVEEYIQFELRLERRHESINGQLFEILGEKDINNELAGMIYLFFLSNLKKRGYYIYNHDVKVAIPNENKYYYPDVFATAELKTEQNQYIKYQPEIIVEVLSKTTHIADTVDKYIDYTKISSLKYYITIEPETIYATLYSKDEADKWQADVFTNEGSVISMPLLNLQMGLKEIYGK